MNETPEIFEIRRRTPRSRGLSWAGTIMFAHALIGAYIIFVFSNAGADISFRGAWGLLVFTALFFILALILWGASSSAQNGTLLIYDDKISCRCERTFIDILPGQITSVLREGDIVRILYLGKTLTIKSEKASQIKDRVQDFISAYKNSGNVKPNDNNASVNEDKNEEDQKQLVNEDGSANVINDNPIVNNDSESETHKSSKLIPSIIISSIVVVSILLLIGGYCISKRNALIDYAKANYGDCEYIKQEFGTLGNSMRLSVQLQDKDTGIEYTVTSSLVSDEEGDPNSDFDKLYIEYIKQEANLELNSIQSKYNMSYSYDYSVIGFNFFDRANGNKAPKAADEFEKVLAKYDVKNKRPTLYVFNVEETTLVNVSIMMTSTEIIYLGTYDVSSKQYDRKYTSDVISYVQAYYDAQAECIDTVSCCADELLPPDEVERLFSDYNDLPSGTAYSFIDKDGNSFMAINMKEFGVNNGGIRLFREIETGMEEIVF
jgi:hypothetical protein